MARVNVTIADDVLAGARAAGLNVSGVATAALAAELDRRARLAELERLIGDLEAERGPVTDADLAAADDWLDGAQAVGAD